MANDPLLETCVTTIQKESYQDLSVNNDSIQLDLQASLFLLLGSQRASID